MITYNTIIRKFFEINYLCENKQSFLKSFNKPKNRKLLLVKSVFLRTTDIGNTITDIDTLTPIILKMNKLNVNTRQIFFLRC